MTAQFKVRTKAKKQMSLSPQTIHVQHRLIEHSQKGRKHWDLYRWLLDPFILCDATKLVLANRGAAGIDGTSWNEIRGKEWAFATQLERKLKSGTYRPRAVRRVYIPKRDGRKRPLGIPTIEDRVLQRALVLLLEPIYEQVFLPNSYGYRRGRSGVECGAVTAREVYRHRHVLEADIEGFYDNVSHRKLLGMLKNKIVDPRILRLIQSILQAGFLERTKPWQPTWIGTPQGGPLSPLLSNVYLHYALDTRFKEVNPKRSQLLRFCDDFIVISKDTEELFALRQLVEAWMREAKLKLKESKTRVIDMRNGSYGRNSHFDFLGFRFHLRAFKDNPNRFWIARQPSEKARQALRENLKSKLKPNWTPGVVRNNIKSVWNGWGNYFRFGNSNRIFYKEIHSLKRLVGWYLRCKYRHQRRPVPWKTLRPLDKWICRDIKPLPVRPDWLNQQQKVLQYALL
jgi:RNA-directed DNA polymerase